MLELRVCRVRFLWACERRRREPAHPCTAPRFFVCSSRVRARWRASECVRRDNKHAHVLRAEFVNEYVNRTSARLQDHMHMVLDVGTWTMPPKTLSGREKHAAQCLTRMWMRGMPTLCWSWCGSFFRQPLTRHTLVRNTRSLFLAVWLPCAEVCVALAGLWSCVGNGLCQKHLGSI